MGRSVMSYWQKKVVIVTGGSAGLGYAIARACAERGATVVIAARDQERLENAVGELSAEGRDVSGHVADVTDSGQAAALVAAALEKHGRLDGLVNCVGRSTRGEVLATTPEEFTALWNANFLSVVNCTRAAAPQLIESHGHLVNIGSLAGKTVSRYLGAYPPSKFAVSAYSQQLRYELGPRGVHVLLVCPGPIRRDDASQRYDAQAANLPDSARRPGGGVKLQGIDPAWLAAKILSSCERRKAELIVPWKARLLLALAQLSPGLGDWIVGRMT